MVYMNLNVSEYTSRVIDVIKAKYGARDKSEAIELYFKDYGAEYIEPEVKPEYLKKLLAISEREVKRLETNGWKGISKEEERKLFGRK